MSIDLKMNKSVFFTFFFCVLIVRAFASGQEQKLAEADAAFQAQAYTEAMEAYENIYADGFYNEAMLYRLSFMHENLKAYPQAIYYLKKAAMEYGNPTIDGKVKQLMQLQGSDRFYPSSAWNTYRLFFKRWGFVVWGLFGLAIAAILAHSFLPGAKDMVWRKGAAAGAWSVAVLLAVVLFHRSFLVPEIGVLTEQTAFYDFPGYAAQAKLHALSIGETVTIQDREDIWVEVAAGDKVFWVPERSVRTL
jgi:tetratricopeptide (TPR) repeat protein